MSDEKPFWEDGRRNVTPARGRPRRGPDVFAGRAAGFATRLGDVDVVRLDIVLPGTTAVPRSYALAPGARAIEWTVRRGRRLPAGLRWRQEAESRFVVEFPLPAGVRCLGLGELYRGTNRRGETHVLFNSDDPNHTESTPRLYKAIPFLILEERDTCQAVFLDSPAPQKWSLGRDLSEVGRVELLTRRGFQVYVMGPASLPAIVSAFTTLTGRAELPPRWSLGHQQCRWSYPTERRLLEVAREFRKRRIPCDTVVADIDYMDDYRVFTVSRERFPHFERMTAKLARQGFRVVTILDPAVKQSRRDATYRSGMKANAFCRTAAGKPYVGTVWAGASHLPDFLREDVRAWWGEQLRFFDDVGVAGIWNDMNEPALFNAKIPFDTGRDELPPDDQQLFLQESPEGKVGHFEVRNLYGSQMARAAYEALLEHRPQERPFVLSRSAYAGHQRFGAVWLGDNHSWFEHLRLSIPMLVSMGLSGVPFCGVDVGGFAHDADGELLARWYQLAIFYPFLRNHCALGRRPHEPWALGPVTERHVKRLIEVRYQLLPYIEGLFHEHRASGAPLMRPLSWHAPGDPAAREIDDQFFLGADLLVAPIVHRGQTRRAVYLPRGKWHPFDGGEPLVGGRHHELELDFATVPAFVRDGAILPLADPVQHTGELDTADLTFRCYGRRAAAIYREDDGQSLGYQLGECDEWELTWSRGRLRAVPTQLGFGGTARRYFVSDGVHRQSFALPR
jgi:alpha-glucosidase